MITIIHTADDEEPICTRCDNLENKYECCTRWCGAEHGWYCYRREEVIKENDN